MSIEKFAALAGAAGVIVGWGGARAADGEFALAIFDLLFGTTVWLLMARFLPVPGRKAG